MSSRTIRAFPGFDRLYEYSGPCMEEPFSANLNIEKLETEISLTRGEWIPPSPIVAKWFLGPPKPGDLVWGGAPGLIVLSEGVFRVFKKHRLTGWSTYPVVLHDKGGYVCEGYAGLSITGRCGPIDEEKSELLPGQNTRITRSRFRGVYFDERTWDSSDFFLPEHTGGSFIVTEGVKDVFDQLGLTTTEIDFTPLTEVIRMKFRDEIDEEEEIDSFVEELYAHQELDPEGFVTPTSEPPPDSALIEYTVIFPYDNEYGKGARVCRDFDEAKAFVLHLLSQGVKQAMILRSHQVIWRTPGIR